MGTQLSPDHVELIRRTIGQEKNLNETEFDLLIYTAERLGLDPLIQQLGVVRRNGKIAIQTSADGHRAIADYSHCYAGSDDSIFVEGEKYPDMATVTVYRMVAGQRCPFTASTRWAEYFPKGDKESFMWRKMPHTMLGKTAEVLALRKAFPPQQIEPSEERSTYADSDGVVTDEINRDTCINWGKKAGTAIKDLPSDHLSWALSPDRNFGPDTRKWQEVIQQELELRAQGGAPSNEEQKD